MASIFKRGGRGAKGGWYIDYYERPGLRRRVYAGRDYEAAKALARELERKALLRREGILDERAERWAEAESRPLADHLADYAAALRAKGDVPDHVDLTLARIRRILDLAGMGRISDLAPSRVQVAVDELRRQGLSVGTCNGYLRAEVSTSEPARLALSNPVWVQAASK